MASLEKILKGYIFPSSLKKPRDAITHDLQLPKAWPWDSKFELCRSP
jgi:hypothetical protein